MFRSEPSHVVPICALLCIATTATADPISAERPGFSTAPGTLAPGRYQVEAGFEYQEHDRGSDSTLFSAPFLLLRAGLTDRTEVQVGWMGYSELRFDHGPDQDGTSDMSVLLKYRLTDEGAATAVGVFGSLSLPVGSDAFSSDNVDPTFGLAWTTDNGLFGTFVLASPTADDERSTEFSGSLGAGLSHGDRLGSFIEYFGTISDSAGPTHQLNGGFTYLPDQNLQIDLYVGAGLNHRAPDLFTGAGVAWRW